MRTIRRITIDIVGWSLLAIGLAGMALPIMPGLPFALIGLYLLSLHSPWFHRQLHRHKHRHPALVSFVNRVDEKVKRFLNLS